MSRSRNLKHGGTPLIQREKTGMLKTPPNPDNMLWMAHNFLTTLSTQLREGVMEGCGISTPTYYRYMRSSIVVKNGVKKEIAQKLTLAEKHMIKQNLTAIYREMGEFHEKFMKCN